MAACRILLAYPMGPGGLNGPGGEVWGKEGMGETIVGEKTEEGEVVGAEETGGRIGLVYTVVCEHRVEYIRATVLFT